jgi:hypothetical protein
LPLKNTAISRRQFSQPSLEAGGKFAIIFSKLFATGARSLVNKRSNRFEVGGMFVICFFKPAGKEAFAREESYDERFQSGGKFGRCCQRRTGRDPAVGA